MPLRAVNDHNIEDAIRSGCRTMRSVFNADDDHVPFFGSRLRPDAFLSFSRAHSESHVPGRHLNALLAAEFVAPNMNDGPGGAAPEVLDEAVAHHRRALMLSYQGGVAPLSLNREKIEDQEPTVFCPHNLREGFHGLYALAHHRADDEAASLVDSSIDAIRRLWHPVRGWDEEQLRGLNLDYLACQGFVHGEARMLGPLVKLHRSTRSLKALHLAEDVAEKLLAEFYLEDGEFSQDRFGTRHAHSVTCCLSSLAQFAELKTDHSILRRVKAFYDHGLWEMRDAIGWSPESTQQTGSDHGEANNTGDIIETALILGAHGWREYDQDAERILRAHLLPSQLIDVSFVEEPDNPRGEDGLRDLANRHQGAWGFPAPYGHDPVGEGRGNLSFNMDIVGGVVSSLSEALSAISTYDDGLHRIRLMMEHETDEMTLGVPYAREDSADVLSITLKRPGAVLVQLPAWVQTDQIRIDPAHTDFTIDSTDLRIGRLAVNQTVGVRFPLPETQITLTHHHDHPIEVLLCGDRVTAMDSLGAKLTFFPDLEPKR